MKKAIVIISTIISALALTLSARDSKELFEAALNADNAGRHKEALTLYLDADSAFAAQHEADSSEYARSLHNTGRAYFNTGDMEKGRLYTLQAAGLREKIFGKVSKEYISTLNNYALSYLLEGKPAEALKYQTEVVDLCRKLTPSHPDEGDYIINLARSYQALDNDKEAAKYMEEALNKVEKFSASYEYVLHFLGMYYMESDDNANTYRILGLMEEHNEQMLKKECDNPECHLERAKYFSSTGHYAEARKEYIAALATNMPDSLKATVAKSYAEFLADQNDFIQAAEYYDLASQSVIAAEGECEKATIFSELAADYYFIGNDFDRALKGYESVIKSFDNHNYNESLKSDALNGIGDVLYAKEDFNGAIAYYKDLIIHLKENGHNNDADYAHAYESLAAAERHTEDYKASISDYQTAIDLYEQLEMYDKRQSAMTQQNLIRTFIGDNIDDVTVDEMAEKQSEKILRDLISEELNALEQAGDYLGPLFKADILGNIARSYGKIDEYDKSLTYYEKYLPTIREAIAEDFLMKGPKERELTWKEVQSDITDLMRISEGLPNDNDIFKRYSALVYDAQLLSKGILLSSNIEFDKVIDRYGTPEMKTKYFTIKANLDSIAEMRRQKKPVGEISRLALATDALQLELAGESAASADYMNYLRISSSDVLEALDPDAVAIEFVTFDNAVLPENNIVGAVAISNEYPTGILFPVATVKALKDMIADPALFSNNNYGKMIWGRILDVFPGKKKIYFAPDGLINNVGIEYLSFGNTPLSEQYDITRLSSTRELARVHTQSPLRYAAVFGDIDYMGNPLPASDKKYVARASDGVSFANLDNSVREIDEIGKILKKHIKKPGIYTGVKAGREEFISQQQLPVNLIHVSTHGKYVNDGSIASDDAMKRSILAFSGANLYDSFNDNEGIVSAADIASMSLRDCDLAVISACESGLGEIGNDGVFGLQRGFKNAGVKTLLVSLNEVADLPTADMMIAFYRHLFEDKDSTRQQALKKAQAEIRSRYPDNNTWASFILIDSFK